MIIYLKTIILTMSNSIKKCAKTNIPNATKFNPSQSSPTKNKKQQVKPCKTKQPIPKPYNK